MEVQSPYHVFLDYQGYIIEERSYRVMPAPLMGTKFATGRTAYSALDFWQVGAMTDFTHGINQKFLVDPSAYYLSCGLDMSKPGELKLERELEALVAAPGYGVVTCYFRSPTHLYIGTSTGKIYKYSGTGWSLEKDTGTGKKIYSIFEIAGVLVAAMGAAEGPVRSWFRVGGQWKQDPINLSGTSTFTYGSWSVEGIGTKFLSELYPGAPIEFVPDQVWGIVDTIGSDTFLNLAGTYTGTGGTGAARAGVEDLFFAYVESDYAYGLFSDGIRQSFDAFNWKPFPPDPLWEMPSVEGIGLNAIAIPRGFLIGTKRGLWIGIGGGSGTSIWLNPDYASESNFMGMTRWESFGVVSIENQGIFYTEGMHLYPTNLFYFNEAFPFKSCKSIIASGWDIFALVSDGIDWYLARCNLRNAQTPSYWWLVKKLGDIPANLASYSDNKLFIFYVNGSIQLYNRISGKFQSSGYLITSLIDEGLIRLQKLYKSISAILEVFPVSTTVTLGYRFNIADSFPGNEQLFYGGELGKLESIYDLPNPSLSNRIQLELKLDSTVNTVTPVVTDLCWTYILERPSEEESVKKSYSFTVIAEDRLEQLTGEVQEVGLNEPRDRLDILDSLWKTAQKKEILNFIGVDNKRELGLILEYTGTASSCTVTVDRTNYVLRTFRDGVLHKTIAYKGRALGWVSNILDTYTDYVCKVHQDQSGARTANDMEPIKSLELKGGAHLYVGTDVHSVILNPQAPGQVKLIIEGRGSDRVNVSLRET